MTHDPLCSIANCRPQGIIALSYPSGPKGGYCEECARECCCDVIAKVRADERIAAANRVADAILSLDYRSADRIVTVEVNEDGLGYIKKAAPGRAAPPRGHRRAPWGG